ncbi:MAG: squalene synthase HpnC [Burkholderiaceae bacterium]|jgi:squalene synthase HpnC|nr:squalene synthase HpnC [Burkholderiaceae bacterium]
MSVSHYENFPVASFLLPARLRRPVESIYAFARAADDIADEGDASPETRQQRLDAYRAQLDRIARAESPDGALFASLQQTIFQHHLPLTPFYDLLSAFRQDTHTPRYTTYDALLDYCRRSANPIGLLMLSLYSAATAENIRMSDAICTALQLVNFWQDVAVDREKNRVYIPQEDMARFGVTDEMIAKAVSNAAWRQLMQFQTDRTRQLMLSGAPLSRRLPGRIGWELRLVVQGGLCILRRLEHIEFDMFRKRPTLRYRDWLGMAWRSVVRYPANG